jgi:DNA-binding LacI/PurR family transcriptional regulator
MNKDMIKVYRFLLSGIEQGNLRPGELLPKERDLAHELNTNRMNVNRAVKSLEKHGLVICKRRVGTKVSPHIDHEKAASLLKATNRSIYVLYSMTPHWIHWNEVSFTGLEEVVEPEGFSVNYCNIPTGIGRAEYKTLLNDISEAGASALVIFPDMEDTEFLCDNADLLLDFQMPIFMLNRSGEPMSLDMVSFVSTDPFGDGVIIGSLLKKNNYLNVLVLNEMLGTLFWGEKRFEGIKMSMMRGQVDPQFKIRQVLGSKEGLNDAAKIIKQANGDIVVVAVNNEYAADLINVCNKKGLKIPQDYQLIAFDDNPLYRSHNLTSMGTPTQEVGKVLGKMICDNSWLGDHKGKISIKLNSKLIVRETLKPELI